MRISTISFIRDDSSGSDKTKIFPVSEKRAEIILDHIQCHNPELVVCAGFTIEKKADANRIFDVLKERKWLGAIFLECGASVKKPLKKSSQKSDDRRYYYWHTQKVEFTKQKMQTGDERQTPAFANLVKDLETGKRTVSFNAEDGMTYKIGLLVCGEIHAIDSSQEYSFVDKKVRRWIKQHDIIVNPTHDRMSNHGYLEKKRKWIAQNLKKPFALYVSSANWTIQKKRLNSDNRYNQKISETLHTVIVKQDSISEMTQSVRLPKRLEDYQDEVHIRTTTIG